MLERRAWGRSCGDKHVRSMHKGTISDEVLLNSFGPNTGGGPNNSGGLVKENLNVNRKGS